MTNYLYLKPYQIVEPSDMSSLVFLLTTITVFHMQDQVGMLDLGPVLTTSFPRYLSKDQG